MTYQFAVVSLRARLCPPKWTEPSSSVVITYTTFQNTVRRLPFLYGVAYPSSRPLRKASQEYGSSPVTRFPCWAWRCCDRWYVELLRDLWQVLSLYVQDNADRCRRRYGLTCYEWLRTRQPLRLLASFSYGLLLYMYIVPCRKMNLYFFIYDMRQTSTNSSASVARTPHRSSFLRLSSAFCSSLSLTLPTHSQSWLLPSFP